MAAYFPASRSSLLEINGVGQVKLDRYGETFMDIIRAYSKANNLTEKPKPPSSRSRQSRRENSSVKYLVGTGHIVLSANLTT